jgi:hypothetical protein
MKNITKEQENFLNKCTWGTWKLNTKTGLVDVDVDFNCSHSSLSNFSGIEFGNISGSFDCSYNKLVSLEGAPQKVGNTFYCYNNQLVSLEGAPQEVSGGFYCSNNQLVSLKGSPKKVGESFYCYNNKLVSLEDAPQKVLEYFICDPINLRDLDIDLLDKIYFYNNKEYFRLKYYIITKIAKELDPEIYIKKMI